MILQEDHPVNLISSCTHQQARAYSNRAVCSDPTRQQLDPNPRPIEIRPAQPTQNDALVPKLASKACSVYNGFEMRTDQRTPRPRKWPRTSTGSRDAAVLGSLEDARPLHTLTQKTSPTRARWQHQPVYNRTYFLKWCLAWGQGGTLFPYPGQYTPEDPLGSIQWYRPGDGGDFQAYPRRIPLGYPPG